MSRRRNHGQKPENHENTSQDETDRQAIRIDKWLWHARRVKSRSLAARLVREGKVRINGQRLSRPSGKVHAGDIVTLIIGEWPQVLKMIAPGSRRGPASEAQGLYADLTPPRPPRPSQFQPLPPRREPGAGRPTKRERRLTDRLRGR